MILTNLPFERVERQFDAGKLVALHHLPVPLACTGSYVKTEISKETIVKVYHELNLLSQDRLPLFYELRRDYFNDPMVQPTYQRHLNLNKDITLIQEKTINEMMNTFPWIYFQFSYIIENHKDQSKIMI